MIRWLIVRLAAIGGMLEAGLSYRVAKAVAEGGYDSRKKERLPPETARPGTSDHSWRVCESCWLSPARPGKRVCVSCEQARKL